MVFRYPQSKDLNTKLISEAHEFFFGILKIPNFWFLTEKYNFTDFHIKVPNKFIVVSDSILNLLMQYQN